MSDLVPPLADEVLRLPDPPPPTRRSAIPLVASAVPVLGAAGLWLATGTLAMLWFAALGPLIALASAADTARAARRQRRLADRDADRARRRVRAAVAVRHDAERTARWARTPDVRRLVASGDTDPVWRTVSGGGDRIVVGRGRVRSTVRVDGGGADAASAAVRDEAGILDDAPVTVALRHGVAVVGPESIARAVVRALVLQACLVHGPDRLRLPAEPVGADDPDAVWLAALPHVDADGPLTLGLVPGENADAAIVRVRTGRSAPPHCAAVLTLTGADRARLEYEGVVTDVRIEGIGHEQAVALAARLRERAQAAFGAAGPGAAVALADIVDRIEPAAEPGAGLDVVVGVARAGRYRLDLVADGPHAVVAGITGSGKSELLTTWITALCARFGTDRVTFLLADFKGGTAFDALARLPHVTGVITDLDAGGAARALQSLRAELRRREAEVVRAGGRDITGTALPRLVIVVDEFAALTAAHPDLIDLFTDIAARGRALGMHLILGTQRAAGTFRESLLANCPLRISLRVTDPADSRALLGGDEAATLSGAPDQRGIALVRRAADPAARAVRIARASASLIADVAAGARGSAPRRPWLPALPRRIALDEARAGASGLVLGVADEPEQQRQSPVVLASRGLCVIGRAESGRTSVLATIAAQAPQAVWIGPDPEAAWDRIAALESAARTVLVDDVDALLARYPLEYAQEVLDRLERIVHGTGAVGARVAMSAQRVGGAAARLLELLPDRAILATSSRADFVAAGGAPADWQEGLPAGRGVLRGRLVQFAMPPDVQWPVSSEPPTWTPRHGVTAVVATAGAAQRRIAAAVTGARVVTVDEAAATADARAAAGGRPAVDTASTADAAPIVVVGDGDQWQRSWRLLQEIRTDGEIVIDAASTTDYRLLTGDRALPPYCLPGRDRAWLLGADGIVRRIVVGAR